MRLLPYHKLADKEYFINLDSLESHTCDDLKGSELMFEVYRQLQNDLEQMSLIGYIPPKDLVNNINCNPKTKLLVESQYTEHLI